MDHRKALKEQYKQMKTDMGIYIFECIPTKKVYMGFSQNLKAVLNSTKFKLESNFFPNRNLLADWKEYGEDNFNIQIIDRLDYDKDESKTDYTSDLETLRELCKERYENVDYIK